MEFYSIENIKENLTYILQNLLKAKEITDTLVNVMENDNFDDIENILDLCEIFSDSIFSAKYFLYLSLIGNEDNIGFIEIDRMVKNKLNKRFEGQDGS